MEKESFKALIGKVEQKQQEKERQKEEKPCFKALIGNVEQKE